MFFRRKGMNTQAAENFWSWFSENEAMIIREVNSHNMERLEKLIQAIDAKLTPVFPYEEPENIEFELGANASDNEFFFFSQGKKTLRRDGETLMRMMPEKLMESWAFIIRD